MNGVRAVDDWRDGKRTGVMVGTWLAFFVVALVLHQSWFMAFLGASVLAVFVRGMSVVVPSQMDETQAVKVWGRPNWFCAVAAVAMAVITFLAVNDGGYGNAMTWLVFGVPTLVMAAMAAKAYGFIGGSNGGGRSFREPSVTAGPSAEDVAEGKIHPSVLGNAGLHWRSPATGVTLVPEILGRGRDDRGRVAFEVAEIPGRVTAKDFEKKAVELASAWGVPRVEVTHPRTNVVRLTAITSESRLTGPVMWQPMDVNVPVAEYVRNLVMGAYVETGDPWVMDMTARNVIAAGIPGSGKSSFAVSLLGHLSRHPDVRIAFLDMKNGTELAPFRPRVDEGIDNHDGDPGVQRALEFISAAVMDMRARYVRMAAAGVTNAWKEGFLGPDEPVKVLVIDESSQLFKTGTPERSKMAAQCIEELRSYIEQGRAAGYYLQLATQYARDDAMPTPIRESASDAIAFRVRSEKGTGAIFGYDYQPESPAVDPTTLTLEGEAVVVNQDDPDGARVRVAFLDKETKAQIVRETAHYRRAWLDVEDNGPQSGPRSHDLSPVSVNAGVRVTKDAPAPQDGPPSWAFAAAPKAARNGAETPAPAPVADAAENAPHTGAHVVEQPERPDTAKRVDSTQHDDDAGETQAVWRV